MILILLSIIILLLFNSFLIYLLGIKNRFSKNENDVVKISVYQTCPPEASGRRAGFSIIVAAKNEAENILQLISSIEKLDYPPGLFEVIIVDDNSSDSTFRVCQEAVSKYKFLKVFGIQESGKGGKRDALGYGISKASKPFIMITDADCLPEKNWIKCYSVQFHKGLELLFGVAPFIQEDFFVNKVSCFENLRSSILSFSFASAGLPFTAAARNLGFSKSSFEKIGGYSKTSETPSGDDDLLIREAVKNNLKIGSVMGEGSFVFSKTKKTLTEYLSQRSRHTQTSFYYLLRHQVILTIWHSINLFFLFSPFLSFIHINFLALLPIKLIMDFIIVKLNQKKFGYIFWWYEIIYLQVIYELFLIIHLFNAKFRKVKWKE